MKKCLLILLALTIVAAAFSSCGTTNGLEVKQKKNDLVISGMNLLSRFDKKLMVNASDSIYMGVKPDGKLKQLIPDKSLNNFTLPGGMDMLPIIVSQVRTGSRSREDFNFAFEVTRDLKVNLLDLDALNKGRKVLAASKGESKTIGICGIEIRALRRSSQAMKYDPAEIFIFWDREDSLALIHHKSNGLESERYVVNREFKPYGENVYGQVIDLRYGRLFKLEVYDDRSGTYKMADVDPRYIQEKCISLIGVRLVNVAGSYFFEITDPQSSDYQVNSGNTSIEQLTVGKVRTADLSRYVNGYYRVAVSDLARLDFPLLKELINQRDASGRSAVGRGRGDSLYPYVIISRGKLNRRDHPELWEKYRDEVRYPQKSTDGRQYVSPPPVNRVPDDSPPRASRGNNPRSSGSKSPQKGVLDNALDDVSNTIDWLWDEAAKDD